MSAEKLERILEQGGRLEAWEIMELFIMSHNRCDVKPRKQMETREKWYYCPDCERNWIIDQTTASQRKGEKHKCTFHTLLARKTHYEHKICKPCKIHKGEK